MEWYALNIDVSDRHQNAAFDSGHTGILAVCARLEVLCWMWRMSDRERQSVISGLLPGADTGGIYFFRPEPLYALVERVSLLRDRIYSSTILPYNRHS